jgi:uncharacterized protein
MYRPVLLLIAASGMTGVAHPAGLGAQATGQLPPQPVITAGGHGESTVAPDRATVMLTVESHSASAAGAASDNAKRTRTTLDTLRAIGLARDQLSTAGYSVEPDYRYDKGASHVIGYIARNTVRAELRAVDQAGRVIDAALAGGANAIGNVEFWASTLDAARHTALASAVTEARGDAEAIAKAAGGSLGPLVELSTESAGPRPRPVFEARALATAAEPTQLQAGDISVAVTVTGRWQFVR